MLWHFSVYQSSIGIQNLGNSEYTFGHVGCMIYFAIMDMNRFFRTHAKKHSYSYDHRQ